MDYARLGIYADGHPFTTTLLICMHDRYSPQIIQYKCCNATIKRSTSLSHTKRPLKYESVTLTFVIAMNGTWLVSTHNCHCQNASCSKTEWTTDATEFKAAGMWSDLTHFSSTVMSYNNYFGVMSIICPYHQNNNKRYPSTCKNCTWNSHFCCVYENTSLIGYLNRK